MRILLSNCTIKDREGFNRSFMLARELVNLGNDVSLLTSLPSSVFKFPYTFEVRDGVKIIAFPDIVPNSMRRTGFGLLVFILKTMYIFYKRYDVYHSDIGHRPTGGIPVLLRSIFFNVTYISEWYNYYGKGGQYDNKKGIKKYTHGLYDLIFEVFEKKRADGVVCLSSAMSERAIKEGIPKSRLTIVSGGADVKSIMFSRSSEKKIEYGIPLTSFTFGLIGLDQRVGDNAFHEVKPFIDALNELSIEHEIFKDSYLITTGGFLPEQVINKTVKSFEVKEFGWVEYETYGEILSCVDIFVLLQKPTLDNKVRWPNKLGDFMAAGRKTIINPYGETVSIVNKYKEPFIIVSYDKSSIKKKLIESAENGKIYLDREKIRKIAFSELSWTQKGRELLQFYNKILYDKELI